METETSTPPTEQFATASDGTPLHWEVLAPAGTKRCPVIVGIHGGGFHKGGTGTPINVCGPDLVAAGFLVISPEYRLAPPGSIAGQSSKGQFPDQTDDIQLAIDAARQHPRSNGKVQLLGGSAGAYMSAWFAAIGVANGVCLSPVTALWESGNSTFTNDCNNYAPGQLIEASPVTQITSQSKPMFVRSFAVDQLPASQYADLLTKLEQNNVEHDATLIPGSGHSFDCWPICKTQAVAWLKAHRRL